MSHKQLFHLSVSIEMIEERLSMLEKTVDMTNGRLGEVVDNQTGILRLLDTITKKIESLDQSVEEIKVAKRKAIDGLLKP